MASCSERIPAGKARWRSSDQTRPPFLDEKTYQDELALVAQTARKVRIPAGLTPGWFRCGQQTDPLISARCLNTASPLDQPAEWFNPTATYQPFPLPAARGDFVDRCPSGQSRPPHARRESDSLAGVCRRRRVPAVECRIAARLAGRPDRRHHANDGVLVGDARSERLAIVSALAFAAALLRLTERRGRSWLAMALDCPCRQRRRALTESYAGDQSGSRSSASS